MLYARGCKVYSTKPPSMFLAQDIFKSLAWRPSVLTETFSDFFRLKPKQLEVTTTSCLHNMSPLSKKCILLWPPESSAFFFATAPRQLLQQQGKTVEELFHSLAENQANKVRSQCVVFLFRVVFGCKRYFFRLQITNDFFFGAVVLHSKLPNVFFFDKVAQVAPVAP